MADMISTFPLSTAFLFPVYETREEYKEKTGQDAPTYDATKPVKLWSDTNPTLVAPGSTKTMYQSCLAIDDETGKMIVTPNGVPLLEPVIMSVAAAKAVNIPPLVAEKPGDAIHNPHRIQVPLRALNPNEALVAVDGVAEIKKLNVTHEETFVPADRALLHKIAQKLGLD